MDVLCLPSFAKLNLGLQVIRKRPDGYHELRTIFQMIDLKDDLTFEPASRGVHLDSTGWPVPQGEGNLILQAARFLQGAGGPARGAWIRLNKRIPVAAGLGGGSSNAATTLIGLRALWSLELGHREMMEIARRLGADVPFFLWGGAALGSGRGDRIRLLRGTLNRSILLVCPPVRLSTRSVFERGSFGLTAREPRIKMGSFTLALSGRLRMADLLVNDLEKPATRLCPETERIRRRLREVGAEAVSMTGSGPSVFGLFPGREAANRAVPKVGMGGSFCTLCTAVSREEFRERTRVPANQGGGFG